MAKYIFVTGGVTSSLGKGIFAASLAKLLQSRGYRVTIQKFDPYINVNPSTIHPYEHGECYVTEDGAETDLDLGHYERFLNIPTSQANTATTGRVYLSVIEKERANQYDGKTVQVIPHITDEIKRRMLQLGKSGDFDIIITEIGGTVGDIEAQPFLESVRQLRWELPEHDSLICHLTLLPFLKSAKELKTKPTQHSVKELQALGLQPDVLVCRTEVEMNDELRSKLALFCNVNKEAVIQALDVATIYEVPIEFLKENLDTIVLDKINLSTENACKLDKWRDFLYRLKNPKQEVKIGLVGKYTELQDAYKSVYEAFIHGGAANECSVLVENISSEEITAANAPNLLGHLDGILVASGFGIRGVEGKIEAIRFARENKVPFLGVCLGMQCAVIEFARNVLGYKEAHSTEMIAETPYPVIYKMPEANGKEHFRLGAYQCHLNKDSLAYQLYNAEEISERHRHYYEFNNIYLNEFEKAGMIATGKNTESNLIEVFENPSHPFFIGVQFRPELKSTVENPHPLFRGLIKAAIAHKEQSKYAKAATEVEA